MPKSLKFSCFFAFCLFWLASYPLLPVQAREEILSFDATVIVHPDAQLSVEEIIRVRAENREIKRGIYRDFPIRSRSKAGLWTYVDFDLIEVLRDGRKEPHFIKYIGNYARIYAGSENTYLNPGEYTYTFKYKTGRQLRYFDAFDELYWNATGNFWNFPIRKAQVRIVLPNGADISRKSAYTGPYGARGENYTIVHDGRNSIGFSTTLRLERNEGLTIAIGWQKGVVEQPSLFENFLAQLWDNLGFGALLIGAFFAARYLYTTWNRVGRDPEKGTIIPLFKPPEGLSPAAVSYVHYQGIEHTGRGASKPFIAALVSLAVKGRMRILEEQDDLAFEKSGTTNISLGAGETVLFNKLLSGRGKIDINKSSGPRIISAQGKFYSTLLHEYEGVFFKKNSGYFFLCLVISIAVLAAFLVLQSPGPNLVGWMIPAVIGSAGGTLLLMQGVRRLFGWIPGGGSKILGILFTIIGVAILLGVLVLSVSSFGIATAIMALAAAGLAAINVLSFFLLSAPTPGGRKVMNDIEGFRMYLSTAEAERMNMVEAPDMSQQLFESYLPYAIGLGVEKPWSDAFTAYLAQATPSETSTHAYQPRWYRGSNWNSDALGRATTGLVSSMSSSMANAMPAPKSSSGSSGGGSSGGGGGGGGGGGW